MEKYKRPKLINSKTIKIITGCGTLYVTIGRDNGNIVEVFANLGKAGSCAKAQNEALTRSISLGLKYGIPIEEYVKELIGIRCPTPTLIGNPDEEILSCSDAIVKVLKNEMIIKEKE